VARGQPGIPQAYTSVKWNTTSKGRCTQQCQLPGGPVGKRKNILESSQPATAMWHQAARVRAWGQGSKGDRSVALEIGTPAATHGRTTSIHLLTFHTYTVQLDKERPEQRGGGLSQLPSNRHVLSKKFHPGCVGGPFVELRNLISHQPPPLCVPRQCRESYMYESLL
jgi:hypothetical protein